MLQLQLSYFESSSGDSKNSFFSSLSLMAVSGPVIPVPRDDGRGAGTPTTGRCFSTV